MPEPKSLPRQSVLVIGAGPAGLTAAHRLTQRGFGVTVVEKDGRYVGGISKTVTYKGFHFDIGGHRFFSKSREVEDYWREVLGDDIIERPRKSRIFYNRRLFSYPLKPMDALLKLGPLQATLCVLSYLKARLKPIPEPKNFEEWITNQFGQRLFSIFFKTYTEKVWGMKCTEISADWAAQRIKGLSMGKAILNAVMPRRTGGEVIKTLIDSFRYPRRGPGMMWEATARTVAEAGGRVEMDRELVAAGWDGARGRWRVTCRDAAGGEHHYDADHVISSMAIRELVAGLTPPPSAAAARAAASLRYRDFLIVALMLKDRQQFDDNWIYIHAPDVKVGRIQNFKSWSPEMVPDPELNCYGMEYFCFEGDALWSADDAALIRLATQELVSLGLAQAEDIVDGHVIRQEKAYPVYDGAYQDHVQAVRRELAQHYPNLHLVGRNGMHKYNNQDHAIMTAMLTVENIAAGEQIYDVWQVNQDAEYHEEGDAGTDLVLAGSERLTPMRAASS
jgi:protoporphyrinogen oxidase